MSSQISAPQSQLDGLSQRSNDSQLASLGQAISNPDTCEKIGGYSSPKMSIKAFRKLHLKEGILEGKEANCFLSNLASILTSLPDNTSSIQSGGREDRSEFENIDPQDMERLRNIVRFSDTVRFNTGGKLYRR
jgi:hypothetical protein